MFEQLTQAWQWGQHHPEVVAGGAMIGAAIAAGLWSQRKGPLTTHGSAKWADLEAIRTAGLLAPRGILLGQWGRYLLRENSEGHVLLCSRTRGRKDEAHNFYITQEWPGSMVIVDIKQHGENYQRLAGWRRGPAGTWPVHRFAPTLADSASYNLLAGVRWGDPAEFQDVSVLYQSMLMPFRKQIQMTSGSQHFLQLALTLGRACTLHTGYALPDKSFAGVLGLMQDQEGCLKALQQSPQPAVRTVGQEVASMYGEEQGGVWTSARNPLDIYRNPLIAQHTARCDFRLTDLQYGDTPMTVYLGANTPGELDYLSPLFRAFLQQAITQNMAVDAPPKWPVLFLLNEALSLGYMDILEKNISVMGGYGMRVVLPIQDLNGLFDIYGEKTPLWGNMGTLVFGRLEDRTAKRVAEMLGEETVEYASEHRPQGMSRSQRSVSMQRVKRPLLTAAELRGLPPSEELIVHERCPDAIRVRQLRPWSSLGMWKP